MIGYLNKHGFNYYDSIKQKSPTETSRAFLVRKLNEAYLASLRSFTSLITTSATLAGQGA